MDRERRRSGNSGEIEDAYDERACGSASEKQERRETPVAAASVRDRGHDPVGPGDAQQRSERPRRERKHRHDDEGRPEESREGHPLAAGFRPFQGRPVLAQLAAHPRLLREYLVAYRQRDDLAELVSELEERADHRRGLQTGLLHALPLAALSPPLTQP